MGEQALGRDMKKARLTPGELAVVDQCHDVAGLDFAHAERAKPVFDPFEVARVADPGALGQRDEHLLAIVLISWRTVQSFANAALALTRSAIGFLPCAISARLTRAIVRASDKPIAG